MEIVMRFALCGILIALSGALLWQATKLSGQASVYPIFVTAGAFLFSIAYTVRQAAVANSWPGEAPYSIPMSALPRVAVFALIWTLYVIALPRAGFIIATWVAITVSSLVIGRLSLLRPLWIAIFVIVLAVLLKVVLYVPVPQGWLDIQLEVFLYSLR
jgi:hypothetical protein